MNKKLLGFATVLTASAWLFAQEVKPWPTPKEDSERKNPAASTPATLKDAKVIYDKQCAVCHGATGNGEGAGAIALKSRPLDFTISVLMDQKTDGELFYKISEGRMPMPAYKSKLSEEQRWSLVNYLRSFSKKDSGKKSKGGR
jgi:mono/diheme cytochrome c family protein